MDKKEYIEREALVEKIREAQRRLESCDDIKWERNKPYFKGLARAHRIVLDATAADVVEVVHGEWKLHGNDDDLGSTYWCSHCYFQVDEELFYPHGYDEEKPYNFCPHCGAKMDGGKHDG